MIYFIRPVGRAGPIKIGCASNPMRRLSDHQRGSPVRLELIGLLEGQHETEHQLHWEFRDCHVHGEWFKPHPDLLRLIERHAIEPMRCVSSNPYVDGKIGRVRYGRTPLREAA